MKLLRWFKSRQVILGSWLINRNLPGYLHNNEQQFMTITRLEHEVKELRTELGLSKELSSRQRAQLDKLAKPVAPISERRLTLDEL